MGIQAGRVMSPMLLRKLSHEGRHNRLFAAARELGARAAHGVPAALDLAEGLARRIFHIAMRVQNLEQMIKGRPAHCDGPSNVALIKALHGAKWHLWHGCPHPALRRLESLGWDLDAEASPAAPVVR
ncbi:hypothetical protein [Cupriavidus sp. amp6]|uniref:hypothetical protein n=1 Tax=Cupriavidus sp. amp6 TaxID=388051 RepID=UPI00048AC10B